MKITVINGTEKKGITYKMKELFSFKLMSDIDWNKIPEKRRASFVRKLYQEAEKAGSVDYTRQARTGLPVRLKFHIVRMMQKGLGKKDPEYRDYRYWKENGWIDQVRPWKS